MLCLEHSFVWCWNLHTSEGRLELPGKYSNVVLEKNGEDQLYWSCENEKVLHTVKWEGKANWIGQILRRKLSSTTHYWRKEKGKERSYGEEEDVSSYRRSLKKDRPPETETGSTRSESVENSLWKRPWTCRKRELWSKSKQACSDVSENRTTSIFRVHEFDLGE